MKQKVRQYFEQVTLSRQNSFFQKFFFLSFQKIFLSKMCESMLSINCKSEQSHVQIRLQLLITFKGVDIFSKVCSIFLAVELILLEDEIDFVDAF